MKGYSFKDDPPILDPPLSDESPGGPEDPQDAEHNPDHELYWAYGKQAGGWEIPWLDSMFRGRRLNSLPYRYLTWCYQKFRFAREFPEAFEQYNEGLKSRIDEDYKDFRVTCGRKHRGQRLRECRDKRWLTWLVSWAKRTPEFYVLHEVFILAAETFLANPGHQEVHRDIGECLSCTEYEDEILEAERECGGILCGYADRTLNEDEQMDEDEEVDSEDSGGGGGSMNEDKEVDEDEEMSEDEDDDGFIVPDTYVEYEDGVEQGTDSDSSNAANPGSTAKPPSPRHKKKGRRKSSSSSHKHDVDDDDIRSFVVPDTFVEYEDGVVQEGDSNIAETDRSPAKSHTKQKQSSPKQNHTTKKHSTTSPKDDIRDFVVPDTFVEYEDGTVHEVDSSSTESDRSITRTAHKAKRGSRKVHSTSSRKADDDDIRNFVVSDDIVEYEDGVEPPESDSENSDDEEESTRGAAAKSKLKSRTKRRRSSQKKGTPRTATISSRTRSKTKVSPKKRGSQRKRKLQDEAEDEGAECASDDTDEVIESREGSLKNSLPATVSYMELDDEGEVDDDDIPLTELAEKSLSGHSSSDSDESDEPPAKKRKTKDINSQDDAGREFENRGLDGHPLKRLRHLSRNICSSH